MALLGGIRLADNFSATKMPQGAASAWAALDGLEFTEKRRESPLL